MHAIHAKHAVSISELRRNPSLVIENATQHAVVILNHNTPSAYLLSPALYAAFLELLEDAELNMLVKQRLSSGENPIEVDVDDL